ncbi:uncharacterized protein LOC128227704 [Mya arenaria]|nr:uncharacterized protein LOC128227704 [Mya arenaria]
MSNSQQWAQRIHNDSKAASEKLMEIRKRLKVFRDNPGTIQKNPKGAFDEFLRCMNETVDFCTNMKRTYVPDAKNSGVDQAASREVKRLQEKAQSLEDRLAEALKAKDQALNRLSDIQCRLLKQGNPDIADLSDDNRPTNLGQNFKGLYEDEWTDALTFLTESRKERISDEKAVETLYKLVQKCNSLCEEGVALQSARVAELVISPDLAGSPISDGQTPSSVNQLPAQVLTPNRALNIPMNAAGSNPTRTGFASSMSAATTNRTQDVQIQQLSKTFVVRSNKPIEQQCQGKEKALEGAIKEFCKNVAPMVIEQFNIKTLISKINSTQEFPADIFDNKDGLKFLTKCVRLCWLMQSQYPPMMLDFSHKPGDPFNKDILTAYSARGPRIAFIVWPPVNLHKGGPLVSKGYAEGKNP